MALGEQGGIQGLLGTVFHLVCRHRHKHLRDSLLGSSKSSLVWRADLEAFLSLFTNPLMLLLDALGRLFYWEDFLQLPSPHLHTGKIPLPGGSQRTMCLFFTAFIIAEFHTSVINAHLPNQMVSPKKAVRFYSSLYPQHLLRFLAQQRCPTKIYWVDGGRGGQMDGQMGDGRMDRWVDRQMGGWIDRWMDGHVLLQWQALEIRKPMAQSRKMKSTEPNSEGCTGRKQPAGHLDSGLSLPTSKQNRNSEPTTSTEKYGQERGMI